MIRRDEPGAGVQLSALVMPLISHARDVAHSTGPITAELLSLRKISAAVVAHPGIVSPRDSGFPANRARDYLRLRRPAPPAERIAYHAPHRQLFVYVEDDAVDAFVLHFRQFFNRSEFHAAGLAMMHA